MIFILFYVTNQYFKKTLESKQSVFVNTQKIKNLLLLFFKTINRMASFFVFCKTRGPDSGKLAMGTK
jgi:hypothetical protein